MVQMNDPNVLPDDMMRVVENVDGNEDMLWCTPENMLQTIEVILEAREQSVLKTSLGGDAARMMAPEIIERMKGLKNLIQDQFV